VYLAWTCAVRGHAGTEPAWIAEDPKICHGTTIDHRDTLLGSHGPGDLDWVMSAISHISARYSARTWGMRPWRGSTSVVALSSYAAGTWRSAVQRADAGTGTGTTVTTDSSLRKSAGLVVNRGSLFAAAMLAIIRSATRPRGLRPMAITSAAIIP
jgi:hypothetical protein